ncbi:NAD-dependent epimerase/dehydratase family protein [uncultured Pseudoteredinibacter sp.]|uniref:NAD-dependent epimerase/dehydratase family protein n=1 Tax=uncultured Pseudoteredinibacter sp. TaxID=1641701 RepID=UPI002609CF85|nr:NAD-dependent epimerase/dehydratase family protein [uncultured Pseudoteredinibacter sp.]
MAIVISGSSGFVGQALIQYLQKQAACPESDSSESGKFETDIVALCRQAPKAAADGVQYQVIDDWSGKHLSATINTGDSIVHLAGRAHQGHKCPGEEARLQEQSHLTLSQKLAKAAKAKGAKRFIYISSAKVFAENSEGHAQAFTQAIEPKPEDPYSRAKWNTEQWLEEYCTRHGLELIILRPGLIYDRHAKGNIAKLQALVNSGLPLPFAGLNKRRDMISLVNLCHLIGHCISCPTPARHTFVAADGASLSTSELITLLAIAEGKKARLFRLPNWLLKLLMTFSPFKQQWQKLSSEFALDNRECKKQLNWQAPFSPKQSLLEHSFSETAARTANTPTNEHKHNGAQ